MDKHDWHIWKADGKFFVLRTTEKPHDHIDPRIPAEVRGTIYSVTQKSAEEVMSLLSGERSLEPIDEPDESPMSALPE